MCHIILQEIILICWFAAQETFRIIINVESSCAASDFFVETIFFINLWWIESSKEKHILEIESFVTL